MYLVVVALLNTVIRENQQHPKVIKQNSNRFSLLMSISILNRVKVQLLPYTLSLLCEESFFLMTCEWKLYTSWIFIGQNGRAMLLSAFILHSSLCKYAIIAFKSTKPIYLSLYLNKLWTKGKQWKIWSCKHLYMYL